MTREPLPDTKSAAAARRDQRLKAALKANMGRRKAQAKAQANAVGDDEKPGDATTADNDKE